MTGWGGTPGEREVDMMVGQHQTTRRKAPKTARDTCATQRLSVKAA